MTWCIGCTRSRRLRTWSSIPPLLDDACLLAAQHLELAVVVDLSARLQVLMAAIQAGCAELGEIAFEIGGENAVN